MKVSAQYAREHLDDLLAAAGSGEEIEIARPANPPFASPSFAPSPR